MADSITEICNMAIKQVGGKRINDFATGSTEEAINCRLYYPTEKNALLELYDWPFARGRITLSPSTTTPDFEWTYQFLLPGDFLNVRENYDESDQDPTDERWELEGEYLMSDESTVNFKYIKKIDDPKKFSALFTELLALKLALKLMTAVAGLETGSKRDRIKDDIQRLERKAAANAFQKSNTTGRSDWNNARLGGIV